MIVFIIDWKRLTYIPTFNNGFLTSFIYFSTGEAKYTLQIIGRKQGTISRNLDSMSVESQFLLTLMILRREYDYLEVAYLFDYSSRTMSAIFTTWLQSIYCKS